MATQSKSLIGRVAGAATGRVLDTIDPDLVLEYVDLDALLERVDIQRVVDRIDLNVVLSRVDVQRLLEQVDLDPLLASVDLEALVRRSGIPEIVAASTTRMAESTLDLGRRQVVGIDAIVGHLVDRLLRRSFDSSTLMPSALTPVEATPEETMPPAGANSRLTVSGHFAGPMARLIAAVIDAVVITAAMTLGYAALDTVLRSFLGSSMSEHTSALWSAVVLFLCTFAYQFVSVAVAGRTVGKGLVGLRVVQRDGNPVTVRQAFVRALVRPLSAALGGLGYLPIVFQREHRALHDLIAGTSVVMDWGERPAELPGPLSAFIARRFEDPTATVPAG